ncbi:DUF3168 domain-containing protein [Brevundimonas bullata]|uniref:DUF3168 domain-containing protein n=1 Tax=Brevundimonas bullata TaxID=13160 RepID=UPI0013B44351|nr:DUF3168 domain-containing protein [Brevundimonas bullata]WQE36730.1 DUF3168 domain-containing protein [Brevundimonas bullata]
MEEAISNLLLGNAGVSALVGDRVNWSARPGAVLPAITLHRITGQRDATNSGRSGLVSSSVQIDIWGGTYSQAKRLARAVVPALPHAQTATGGVVLQGIFIDSESDSFEGEDPTPLYRTRIDISVWHQEI